VQQKDTNIMTLNNNEQIKKPTFSVFTLGCKVNQYETDKIRDQLVTFGFREIPWGEKADFCIINTCTVTREAARKSRQMSRKALISSPGALVFSVGCAAEIPEITMDNIPGEIILLDNSDKEKLGEIIRNKAGFGSTNTVEPVDFHPENRTRIYLKVQDGCDHFCSYCIIPYVRGRSRSREPEDILGELREIETYSKEVILTGIHLGDYGKKISSSMNLSQLVNYLLQNSNIPRIRLSSLEPMDFSYDLLKIFSDNDRLCRHLHLPLQHGSDRILKLMKRNYSLKEFDMIVKTAVESIPGIAVTTDVIVGFPGETNEDFEITYQYIRNSPIARLHVFPFSSHPGTKAAEMKDKVENSIKKERLNRMLELGRRKVHEFLDNFIETCVEVLVEQVCEEEKVSGHTSNYIGVMLPGNHTTRGEIFKVKIIKRVGEILYGENPELVRYGG
jgi:threonylcarbamoyladenosine tRNA methylthiotransferase MtaB